MKSDENSRKWLNEFRTKPFSVPGKLEDVDGKNSLPTQNILSLLFFCMIQYMALYPILIILLYDLLIKLVCTFIL